MKVFFLLFLTLSTAKAETSCKALLQSTRYHQGLSIPNPNRSNSLHLLGSGAMGGDVYRITHPENGSSVIKKIYIFKEQLQSDLLALSFLQNWLPSSMGIKFLQPLFTNNKKTVLFPDVQGFAMDKWPAETDRETMLEGFANLLDKIEDKPAPEGFTFTDVARFDSLSLWIEVRDTTTNKSFDIMFKPDNVIVESRSGAWVIFDPY